MSPHRPLHPSRTGSPPGRGATYERLLAAADELFYVEGVNSVGIDRVIERAGVAKASLYRLFGSKEELVAAYLRARHERILTELRAAVDRHADPRARILAVFDAQARWLRHPDYHGCAFTRASAETSAGVQAQQVTDAYRQATLDLLTDLAAQAGAGAPKELGAQLHLLYHAAVTIGPHHRRRLVSGIRSAAEILIDAALADTD